MWVYRVGARGAWGRCTLNFGDASWLTVVAWFKFKPHTVATVELRLMAWGIRTDKGNGCLLDHFVMCCAVVCAVSERATCVKAYYNKGKGGKRKITR